MKIKKMAKSAVSLLLSAIMAVSMAVPVLATDTGSAQDVYYYLESTNDSDGDGKCLHLCSGNYSGRDNEYELVSTSFPQWQDKLDDGTAKWIDIVIEDEIYPATVYEWFANFYILRNFEGGDNLNTKYADSMVMMFENTNISPCKDFIEGMDVSSCMNMNNMFASVTGDVDLDLSNWDMSSSGVTMNAMFTKATELKSVVFPKNGTTVSNVVSMFNECTLLTKVDISGLTITDETGVKNDGTDNYMFCNCTNISEISVNQPSEGYIEFPISQQGYQWYLADSCLHYDNDVIPAGVATYYGSEHGDHRYEVTYNWDSYNLETKSGTVYADIECTVCYDSGAFNVAADVASDVSLEPTCETSGTRTFTASISDTTKEQYSLDGTYTDINNTKTVEIAATGEHQWVATFDWDTFDSDNNTITANLVCSECGSTVAVTGCTVSSKTVSPTCGEDGTLTYTASISDTNLNDNGISGTISSKEDTEKIEYLDATGDHSWNVTYDWNGYTSVSAALVCDVCGDTETVPASNCGITSRQTKTPTCTVQGEMTYTASVGSNVIDNLGGSIKQETNKTKTEALSTTDHTWTFDENDSDSYIISLSGGWMQFILTCSVCGETYTTERVALEFNQYDEYQGQSGITVCLATIKVGGKTYTFEKNINEVSAQAEQEMEQHDWVQSGDSTVATCTEDGKTYYYCATCSATKTIIEASKGHTWDVTNATWKWSNDLSSCSVTADCTTCGWHETTDCTITASSSSGSVIYTATATMSDGQVLRDTKLADADAQGGTVNNNQSANNATNSVSPAESTPDETTDAASDSTTTAVTELNASDGDATTNDTMTVQPTSTAFDNATENTAETTNVAKTGDTASIAGVATLCALTMLTAAAVTYRKRVRSDDESSSD